MTRTASRVRIDQTGALEVVDPGFDAVPLLRSVDPAFDIRSAPLDGFVAPRLLETRAVGCGASGADLGSVPDRDLWAIHRDLRRRMRLDAASPRRAGSPRPGAAGSGENPARRAGEGSLIDVKIELARRLLQDCRLCGQRCSVDRTRGETGVCGLGTDAVVAEHFVHVAEEPPINPSLVLNLAGCGLRCRYCQQGRLLAPPRVAGETLDAGLWRRLDPTGARSLSFVGGNPDESLYAILCFLSAAPVDWKLPIAWNCHAYGGPEALELLDGVVDAFVPDVKYGNDGCGERLSGVSGYSAAARSNLEAMLAQGVPVIARVLVLPGHVDCCHLPALDALRALASPRLVVSIRGQYSPDYRITARDGALARRVAADEVEAVRRHAADRGLPLAGDWNGAPA